MECALEGGELTQVNGTQKRATLWLVRTACTILKDDRIGFQDFDG